MTATETPLPAKIPSRWYYAIGGFVFVAAFAIFIIVLVVDVRNKVPDIRVSVPGTQEISFNDDGKYTIFYEYKSSLDGKKYSTGESLNKMLVSMKTSNDTEIQLSDSSVKRTYQVGSDRSGFSILEFKLDQPGNYTLTAVYQDGSTGPEVVFAIGKFNVLGTVLKSLAILASGFIIGSIAIVWVYMKRNRIIKAGTAPPRLSGL